MPLFYQHNINDSARIAVWHITEGEDFFLQKVSVSREITHPHKRLQHLAGRYLLLELEPGFPIHLIEIAASKKPLLANEKYYFSISHCDDYAAVIVSDKEPAGIDVELIVPKIEMIKNKFLSENEIELLNVKAQDIIAAQLQLLTLFWSSKEAIYKWYGKGKVDFKKNMIIENVFIENDKGFIDAHFEKGKKIPLKIEFHFFGRLCLAWVLK